MKSAIFRAFKATFAFYGPDNGSISPKQTDSLHISTNIIVKIFIFVRIFRGALKAICYGKVINLLRRNFSRLRTEARGNPP